MRLLRAVRIDIALRNFGAHWAAPSKDGPDGGVSVAKTAKDYDLSHTVGHIDDFISHDWATGRWAKFFSLCFIYNGVGAYVGSCIAGLGVGILQAIYLPESKLIHQRGAIQLAGQTTTVIGYGWCSILVCPVVFTVLLFFGQRLRRAFLGTSRLVFLDKLCIHQTDPVLKAEGILSIAGFLRSSKRLVVLWSPLYFTRLWCVYEVATWIYLNRTRTRFFPVALGVGILTALLCFNVLVWVLTLANFADSASTKYGSAAAGIMCCIFPAVHALRRLMRDLSCMPTQIGNFSARSAECFCCKHDHIHPLTNEPLPCDRLLVYDTLFRWLLDSEKGGTTRDQAILEKTGEMEEDELLDQFDEYVRQQFGPRLLRKAGGTSIRFRYALIVCAPMLWYSFDQLTVVHYTTPAIAAHYIVEWFALALFVATAVAKVVWGMASLATRILGIYSNPVLDLATSFCLALLGSLIACILWMPVWWTSRREKSLWPLLLVVLLCALLDVLLFFERGARCEEKESRICTPTGARSSGGTDSRSDAPPWRADSADLHPPSVAP